MKRSFLLCLAIFEMTFVSCAQRNTTSISGEKVEIIKDNNGNLISELPYIQDTVLHGIAKYYYQYSNVLKDEIQYEYGRKNGYQIRYYRDGKVECRTFFKDDKPHGITTWYYEDGQVKETTNWIDGQSVGEAKWIFPNGQMELLNYVDFSGKTYYVVQYDVSGKIIHEEGRVFAPKVMFSPSVDSIIKEQPFETRILTSVLPGRKTVIKVVSNNETVSYTCDTIALVHTHTFKSSGLNSLVIVGEMYSEQGELIKTDREEYQIMVQ